MREVFYFENENQTKDKCCGQVYYDFIDYAFAHTDFFMLVYVNYYGKGYSKIMKEVRDKLRIFSVKSRSNPSWPGTLNTFSKDSTYKVIFYKTDFAAAEVLKKVNCLSAWSCPQYPQDLAFFKGNKCWFYSVGHERIGAIIDATEEDFAFLESKGLISKTGVRYINYDSEYFAQFNENLIT